MNGSTIFRLLLATAAIVPLMASAADAPRAMIGFKPANAQAQRALEAKFDAGINASDLRGWMERMSSAPNHVGSPHDKVNADFILSKFKEWGWDAHIETFYVLYPTPKTVSVEMVAPTSHKATMSEGPVTGDRTSTQVADELPPYTAFGGDGDVTADVVYVNQGMPADYEQLARNGIDVKGKIVMARYGGGWRGLKPKLAQEHGAVACIIYSDPADDGYGAGEPWPKGAERPPQGVQRGSVLDLPVRPGDPLTPNIGATKDAKRLTKETAETVLKIPVLPISYGDAQPILAALAGPMVPPNWRGGLPITYHMGPGPAKVHMVEQSDWSLKPLYNVIATLQGSEFPDQWVVRGNHHDGWVFGAQDPLSGNVAMLAEAQSIGKLVKGGWKPKRTLVYTSWDGEEPALLGSTEWAEQHAADLTKKGVLYINSDGNGRGFLGASGTHSYQRVVNQIAGELKDPQTGVSVLERQRARADTNAYDKRGSGDAEVAEAAAKGGDMPIGALGSGSDYTPFLQHLGLASINLGYGGEGSSDGVYHSAYDSFDHYIRYGDPEFAYGVMLAKTAGRLALRTADADVLPVYAGDFADTMGRYGTELHKLVDDSKKHQEALDRLLKNNAFKVAGDPTKTTVPPAAEPPMPAIDLAKLDAAITKLKRSAADFDAAREQNQGSAAPAQLAQVNAVLAGADRTLLNEKGLPGRPWYKNLIYAPGLETGYGVKTLPGVREALEGKRWNEANQYAGITAGALEAYAATLDKATALMKKPGVTN
ncbi:MAG: transferrin receptor-like dimerization domain-containing protein [Rhodospirillaceae bacterium]